MCCRQKSFTATNLSELVKKIMNAEFIPLPDGYSNQLKYLINILLQIDPGDRPTAYEVLKFYIPLVYKNLGKLDGYSYQNKYEKNFDATMKSSSSYFLPNVNREYLEASTATMNDYVLHERSILYQMKSFGNHFSLDPVQLPSTIKFKKVATSGSHFLIVTEGKRDCSPSW
jgi:NIMA (never in mitosis gene a)-related kinase 8